MPAFAPRTSHRQNPHEATRHLRTHQGCSAAVAVEHAYGPFLPLEFACAGPLNACYQSVKNIVERLELVTRYQHITGVEDQRSLTANPFNSLMAIAADSGESYDTNPKPRLRPESLSTMIRTLSKLPYGENKWYMSRLVKWFGMWKINKLAPSGPLLEAVVWMGGPGEVAGYWE